MYVFANYVNTCSHQEGRREFLVIFEVVFACSHLHNTKMSPRFQVSVLH